MFVSRFALARGFLCAPEGDPPAPGGGGATTDLPKTLTELNALVGNMVNGAVKSELRKAVPGAITEGLKGINWKDTLGPSLTELLPKPPENGSDKGPGGGEPKPDPRIAALEASNAELKKNFEASEKARKDAEIASRDQEAFSNLRTALQPHIKDGLLDMVARDLFHGQKRISFDDNGRPLLTVKKAAFPGAPDEDVLLTLQDGAAHFAKHEGKEFAPVPDAGGSKGNKGPGNGARRLNTDSNGMPLYDKPAASDEERMQRSLEKEQALKQRLNRL